MTREALIEEFQETARRVHVEAGRSSARVMAELRSGSDLQVVDVRWRGHLRTWTTCGRESDRGLAQKDRSSTYTERGRTPVQPASARRDPGEVVLHLSMPSSRPRRRSKAEAVAGDGERKPA